MPFTEDNYEKALISLFEGMDYQYLYGPNIERDYYVPYYEAQLEESLQTVNPKKPHAAIHEAIIKLRNFGAA